MKLVIVESPTKAKTISKFLGKEYEVESSYGHVRDLPKSKFAIDLENDFEPTYIIPVKAKKRVTELRKIAEKSDEIILASDEDREGEAIAYHLSRVLTEERRGKKPKEVPMKRIVFHEITKTAIEKALANPRPINQPMVEAQQARRVLDRIVGYKLSPFLWEKIAKGLSAGRVQSVALRLIVDREEEIKKFVPEEYWSITALLKKEGDTFEATLNSISGKSLKKFDVPNKEESEKIVKDLEEASCLVTKVEEKETKKNPPAPFTTSTLQQTSSSRLNYSAKKTMILAQHLYERGYITYMRTDSLNLSQESVANAKDWLETNLGKEYALPSPRTFKTKSKGAQEAHEAIRPTQVKTSEELGIDKDEKKLYDLIFSRFLGSQMPEAKFLAKAIHTQAKSKEEYGLRTTGTTMVFDGFLKIYHQQFEEKELPDIKEQDKPEIEKVVPAQHFTEPPPRYTEARLIKTLEEFGIGRPSTYVPIISVIQARNYVEKEAGRFMPTEIGTMVNSVLTKHFQNIVDIGFTAKMEESLDKIAVNEIKWQDLLAEFYSPFAANLEKKYEEVEKKVEDETTDKKCDKCGSDMVIKFSRFGKFYACTGFPDCRNTESLKKNKPKSLNLPCPDCKKGEIVEKFTHKRGKRKFWGCSKYPDCEWASWKDPSEEDSDKKDSSKDESTKKETKE